LMYFKYLGQSLGFASTRPSTPAKKKSVKTI
jgi:hypothetical protein